MEVEEAEVEEDPETEVEFAAPRMNLSYRSTCSADSAVGDSPTLLSLPLPPLPPGPHERRGVERSLPM